MKTLLPEAGALERATTYRDKKIKPLFTQVKNKIAAMAAQVKELAEEVEKWKHKLSYYLDNWESIDFDDKRKPPMA